MRIFRKQQGMTLLEIMMVVALVTVLTSLGILSVRAFVSRGRLFSATEAVTAAVRMAGAESVRSSRRVGVRTNSEGVDVFYAPHRETTPPANALIRTVEVALFESVQITPCVAHVWLDHRGFVRDVQDSFTEWSAVLRDVSTGRVVLIQMAVSGAVRTVHGVSECPR